ncbi:TetR/AcrR family transcriptional regulator [Streptomyces sp. NPDC057411]|uniref:TetR/AcrR family transcriptional regulator n=1 Tax=unclassified Streptomyces TaxID=2593676 RepID=UPI0036445E84
MSGSTRTDGRVERGNQTRRLVLGRTMDIASVEGLEGLSLGRIATELKQSKSGVFARFGSKEELQLATVRAAAAVIARRVVTPPAELPPGPGKVWALCRNWLDYSAERVFAGGCFFSAVSAEFDARTGPVHDAVSAEFDARTGPVHDAVSAARREWIAYVERTIEEAREAGGLVEDADAGQLAFEIIALRESANAHSVLLADPAAYERAARGIARRLRAEATDAARDEVSAPGTWRRPPAGAAGPSSPP